MKTLKDFDLKDKKVLVRCNFNVPLSEKGELLDDFRIKKNIPTISYLIEKGAKIILMGHLKRPEVRDEKFSLKIVVPVLEKLLNQKITFLNDCIGEEVEQAVERMKSKEIIVLENIRFYYNKEKENNEDFAKSLAKLGDIYINDDFSNSHRDHASTTGITKFLPSGAGFLLENEIEFLSRLRVNPKKPLIVIIGGKKVGNKGGVIDEFMEIADYILINPLIEKEIRKGDIEIKYPKKIIGSIDVVDDGKDIGDKTIEFFKEKISEARTVFWAGVLGETEEDKYIKGSQEIAKAIIKSGAFAVAGGGETVAFLNKLGITEEFSHVSTGGGAMLTFLSGEKLPAVEVLKLQQINKLI